MPPDPPPDRLSTEQWLQIEPLLPPPGCGGRRREVDLRRVVEAILFIQSTGCPWRRLPARFPHSATVRRYFDTWRSEGIWEAVERTLDQAGGGPLPSARGPSKRSARDT